MNLSKSIIYATSVTVASLLIAHSALAVPLPQLKPEASTGSGFTPIAETATPVAVKKAERVVSRSVVDQANILDRESEFRLTQALGQFQLEKQVQIVVLTTASLRGYDIDKYAAAVSKQWGVAATKEKPGVLVVVAPNEQFVKIRVGPGLQDWMPDQVANHLIEKFMIPAFAQSKWQEGIVRGSAGIIAVLGRDKPIEIAPANNANPVAVTAPSTQTVTAVDQAQAVEAPMVTQVAARSPESKATSGGFGVLLWPMLMLLLAFAALAIFWFRGRKVEELAQNSSDQSTTENKSDLDLVTQS